VLLSIGIVVFITVTRGKKSGEKSINEEKQEELFMNELRRRDKELYEEIKRNTINKTNNHRHNDP
jgi:hypothetical protein